MGRGVGQKKFKWGGGGGGVKGVFLAFHVRSFSINGHSCVSKF